jgi:hypothetical protein
MGYNRKGALQEVNRRVVFVADMSLRNNCIHMMREKTCQNGICAGVGPMFPNPILVNFPSLARLNNEKPVE